MITDKGIYLGHANDKEGASKRISGYRHQIHSLFFHHEYNGKKTGISTYFSHSARQKDISGDLLTFLRKQLSLDKSFDVVELLECPMRAEDYNTILITKGVFKP